MSTTEDKLYKNRWDERYGETEYAYGKDPNVFFKRCLASLIPGHILMPADGEGRNGVYAAEKGWQVTSTDLSQEGKFKTLELAKERRVTVEYLVGDLEKMDFPYDSFDAIGLIYAHFAAAKKAKLHKQLGQWVKPGGMIIFEAFSKNHLPLVLENPEIGGPKDEGMLFSIEELKEQFSGFRQLYLQEETIEFSEGKYHVGKGKVIRFIGIKPKP